MLHLRACPPPFFLKFLLSLVEGSGSQVSADVIFDNHECNSITQTNLTGLKKENQHESIQQF